MDHEKLLSKVLNFLSYQPRTTKEITDKVEKYTKDQEILKKVIEDLEKSSLLDDFKYAVEYVENKANSTIPPGKRKMENFLRKKGVKKQYIDQAIDLYTFEKEEKGAETVLQKRLRPASSINSFKEKQKIWRFLSGKGYSKDVVDAVVDRKCNF